MEADAQACQNQQNKKFAEIRAKSSEKSRIVEDFAKSLFAYQFPLASNIFFTFTQLMIRVSTFKAAIKCCINKKTNQDWKLVILTS